MREHDALFVERRSSFSACGTHVPTRRYWARAAARMLAWATMWSAILAGVAALAVVVRSMRWG